jgi:hypothetical protein
MQWGAALTVWSWSTGCWIGLNSGAAKGSSGESMAVGQHLAVRDIGDEIAGCQDRIHLILLVPAIPFAGKSYIFSLRGETPSRLGAIRR